MEKHTRTLFALSGCLTLGLFLILSLPRSSTSFTWRGHLSRGGWFLLRRRSSVHPYMPSICELKPEWARLRGVTMDTRLVAIAIPATTQNHFDHLFGAIDMRPRENQFPLLEPSLSLCGYWLGHRRVAAD